MTRIIVFTLFLAWLVDFYGQGSKETDSFQVLRSEDGQNFTFVGMTKPGIEALNNYFLFS